MSAPAARGARARAPLAGFLLSGEGWPYLLVVFIPLALALRLGGAPAAPVFVASALGIVPTAALMGLATDELAVRAGPGIGGLLNVTFGNAPELIIALFALHAGLQEVVKASLIGSVLGNTLLVMGGAMLAGGLRRRRLRFSRQPRPRRPCSCSRPAPCCCPPASSSSPAADSPCRAHRRATSAASSSRSRPASPSCC